LEVYWVLVVNFLDQFVKDLVGHDPTLNGAVYGVNRALVAEDPDGRALLEYGGRQVGLLVNNHTIYLFD